MDSELPYATPRTFTDPADCYFYHTLEVPGYGLFEGEWDLREGVEAYLGGVDFRGRRVLEIGKWLASVNTPPVPVSLAPRGGKRAVPRVQGGYVPVTAGGADVA